MKLRLAFQVDNPETKEKIGEHRQIMLDFDPAEFQKLKDRPESVMLPKEYVQRHWVEEIVHAALIITLKGVSGNIVEYLAAQPEKEQES